MKAKILIVDDEPFNLEIIDDYFDGTGYDLSFFATGEAAWQALQAPGADYDLAILDRMMPGLDGITLLERIKADVRFAALPVIMQTAASSPEQLREGMQAGAYYYLTKPYERDSLLSIVRASLRDVIAKTDLRQRRQNDEEVQQLLHAGRFELRTVEEASRLAGFLARATPRPDETVLALAELLINGVEHGNLGISYAEKSALKRLDQWQEEIERRSGLAENCDKRVRVELDRRDGRLTIRISDDGPGFDWHKYLEFDPQRAFDPNGRGIAMARKTGFDTLDYQGCGNTVVLSILETRTDE